MNRDFLTKYIKLSPELLEKQKLKGTYDSPCMSVCDYAGPEQQCLTCGMRKEEKARWKVASSCEKKELLHCIQT